MFDFTFFLVVFFFFFQAEDGIRDLTVTGVQTCALPICFIRKLPHGLVEAFKATLEEVAQTDLLLHVVRSEEHTSELQSQSNLVCRLLLEKKKKHDRPVDASPLNPVVTITCRHGLLHVSPYT